MQRHSGAGDSGAGRNSGHGGEFGVVHRHHIAGDALRAVEDVPRLAPCPRPQPGAVRFTLFLRRYRIRG